MPYDSPKTIRRRQQRADAIRPKRRQADRTKVMTDEQWDKCCDFHLAGIHAHAEAGLHDNVCRHARALVTMAVQRRASVIMRDFDLHDLWTALRQARNEIYGEAAS
jgi:hypothetical protein